MSEYTQYFIVKAASENNVKQHLNEAKIASIVDPDKEKYWFEDAHKKQNTPNWIVVTAPPESGTIDGQYCYENKFNAICTIFETVILFFEEENASDWSLDIYCKGTLLSKKHYSGKNIDYTSSEKIIMEDVFEIEFDKMAPLLGPGKSAPFLNTIGIPYMQMNDQDNCSIETTATNYSFLASELG